MTNLRTYWGIKDYYLLKPHFTAIESFENPTKQRAFEKLQRAYYCWFAEYETFIIGLGIKGS